jgi:hypothetical protein
VRLSTFFVTLALAGSSALAAHAAPASGPAAQPGTAEYTPEGAPRDDYNFVAWCEGVLEGHMALAEHVQSVLPLDEVQQKIGKAYLKGYEQALDIGKKGRSDAELDAAQAIRYAARANWNTAMGVDLQLGADTYLAWQLPGRCEHAAKRVAKRDDIFQLAPSVADVEAMGAGVVDDTPTALAPASVADAPAEALPDAPDGEPVGAMAGEAMLLPQTEDLGGGDDLMTVDEDAAVGTQVMPDDATSAEEAPAMAAVEPAGPEEVSPVPVPATESRPADNDGKVVHMPRKGRLFPWGKRE